MWVLLLLCFNAHFNMFPLSLWIVNLLNADGAHSTAFGFGICFLCYPLCGWLTEVYSDSSRIVKRSFFPLLLSSIGLVSRGLLEIYRMNTHPHKEMYKYLSASSFLVIAIPGLVGLGMFEANAIQFGMDQMMDASSEQLSSFIHWYFWCAHIGPLVIFYLFTMLFTSLVHSEHNLAHHDFEAGVTNAVIAVCQIVVCIGSLLIVCSKRVPPVQPMSRNSLKLLYQVLKYSYYHKYPVRRSALSYWENDLPSRIDLGKDKYGGPFTYEQVEDVKTFFRLLLLMASLFGVFLLGDGFSLTQYIIQHNGCPSFTPFIMAYLNPQHLTLLTVLIGIPVFRCSRKVLLRYIPNLLSRLWIGLYVALIAVAIQTLLSLFIGDTTIRSVDCQIKHVIPDHRMVAKCALVYSSSVFYSNYTHICPNLVNPDNIVYVFIAPLILYGVSYLLVFITMLEFVCAQAPNSMKGLLIGLWYSMLSIKYSIVYNLDIYLLDTISWYMYNLAKGAGIFISIILFSLACKHYRYREKNEVVNYQNIIEEQYERELLLNESDSSIDSNS